MAEVTKKKVVTPLVERLSRFTSFRKVGQLNLVNEMLATVKPTNEPRVNPFDNPFFDYEIVWIFTGAGFIVRVKRRPKKGGIPSKKTFAAFKKDVEQFMAKGYKAAASSLIKVKGMKTLELTSTAYADDRILLLIPTGK
jgi:hypothetical protein